MLFTEYKNASERHLISCLKLFEELKTYETKDKKGGMSSKEAKYQYFLLSDLYYLSGYMLECLYSYAMCKYENSSTPISRDVKTELDPNGRTTPYKICFTHSKRSRYGVHFSIARPKHQMSLSELSFFSAESLSTVSSVPLLDNRTHLSNPNSHSLFLYWSAYERYKINHFEEPNFPNFNYKTVTDFFWDIVDVCAKLSQHILREVTLFRRIIKKKP